MDMQQDLKELLLSFTKKVGEGIPINILENEDETKKLIDEGKRKLIEEEEKKLKKERIRLQDEEKKSPKPKNSEGKEDNEILDN